MDRDLPQSKDHTLVPVGFRIPRYLVDFIESHEDPSKNINKSGVMRSLLSILYENKWFVDEKMYGKLEKVKNVNEDGYMDEIKALNAKVDKYTSFVEKLLGFSVENLLSAPDHIIERIIDEAKQTSKLK